MYICVVYQTPGIYTTTLNRGIGIILERESTVAGSVSSHRRTLSLEHHSARYYRVTFIPSALYMLLYMYTSVYMYIRVHTRTHIFLYTDILCLCIIYTNVLGVYIFLLKKFPTIFLYQNNNNNNKYLVDTYIHIYIYRRHIQFPT